MIAETSPYALVAISEREGYAFLRSTSEPEAMWLVSREQSVPEQISSAELGRMVETDSSLKLLAAPVDVISLDEFRAQLVRESDSRWIREALADLTSTERPSTDAYQQLLHSLDAMVTANADAASAFNEHLTTFLKQGNTLGVARFLQSAQLERPRTAALIHQALTGLLNEPDLPSVWASAVGALQREQFHDKDLRVGTGIPPIVPRVSVIIPCFNDGDVLEERFATIRRTLDRMRGPFELVLVDDASRDNTASIMKAIVDANRTLEIRTIVRTRNDGIAAALKDGFRAARGEMVGYFDLTSWSTDEDIASLTTAIEDGADIATVRRTYDVAVGSAVLHAWTYSFLARHVLSAVVPYSRTVPRLFRRQKLLSVLDDVHLGWFWDAEIVARASRRRLRIVEVPGTQSPRVIKREGFRAFIKGLSDSILQLIELRHVASRQTRRQENRVP